MTMLNHFFKILFTAIFVAFYCLALTRCSSVLEIKIDSPDPQIVVNCLFTEGAPWKVVLQQTVGVQQESIIPAIIDHAKVTIEGSDGTFLTLSHEGGGFYFGESSLPKMGVVYTLTVEATGFESVEATDQLPSLTKIQEVVINSESERIFVTLEDDGNAKHYYTLSMLTHNIQYGSFQVLNAELNEQMKQFSIQDPLAPYIDQPIVRVALIHDEPFNGQTFTMNISPQFSSSDPTTYLHTVSSSYYDYYLTKTVQENSRDTPFAEPSSVTSNIMGGHGVFAGYMLDVDGDDSPEILHHQLLGTYTSSGFSILNFGKVDTTPDHIEFTLHPKNRVTGFMQVPHESLPDSMMTVSLDGAYNISHHDGLDYQIRLYHDAQTLFRNTELILNRSYSNRQLSLMMIQSGLDANGRFAVFQRTFIKTSGR